MPFDAQIRPNTQSPDSSLIWVLPPALQELSDCGETELVEELITTFEVDTESRLKILRAAVRGGQYPTVKVEAHTIKGAAAQVGAIKVAECCLQVELEALKPAPTDLEGRFGRLMASFEEVCAFFSTRRAATGSAV